LDDATGATAGFIYGDRNAFSLEIESRGKSGDAGSDDGD
jgi:hypothetical protein